MNNLKKLVIAFSLTIILAGAAMADCLAPVPGEINAPPCLAAQQLTDDSTNQATTTITTELEIFALDTVIERLENLLTVY